MTMFLTAPALLQAGKDIEISVVSDKKKKVKEYQWIFDEVALIKKSESESSLVLEPLLTGDYSIRLEITFEDNTKRSLSIMITDKQALMTTLSNQVALNAYEEIIVANEKEAYDLPHFVKRNARYRGHRESEKVAASHNEQLYDIRKNHEEIKNVKRLAKDATKTWFHGRNKSPLHNSTISGEKVYQATTDRERYLILEPEETGEILEVVVKLDNETVNINNYLIDDDYLLIDINNLGYTQALLSISYTILLYPNDAVGIHPLMRRCQQMHERITELERRALIYENAYK